MGLPDDPDVLLDPNSTSTILSVKVDGVRVVFDGAGGYVKVDRTGREPIFATYDPDRFRWRWHNRAPS